MMNYKGLHAVREHLNVNESEIDRQIDKMLESSMRTIPVTGRPTQADDEIILDYAGEIGGEFFDGGTAQKQALVLGSGTFIPGFEEQLIGKNIGDTVDVKVTFPEKYHAEALGGKGSGVSLQDPRNTPEGEIQAGRRIRSRGRWLRTASPNSANKVRESMQAYIDRQADDEVKDRLAQPADRSAAKFSPTEEERESCARRRDGKP